jgi:hypothetical protein
LLATIEGVLNIPAPTTMPTMTAMASMTVNVGFGVVLLVRFSSIAAIL